MKHSAFGQGIVQEVVKTRSGDEQATVSFAAGLGTKRLVLTYAPLVLIKKASG